VGMGSSDSEDEAEGSNWEEGAVCTAVLTGEALERAGVFKQQEQQQQQQHQHQQSPSLQPRTRAKEQRPAAGDQSSTPPTQVPTLTTIQDIPEGLRISEDAHPRRGDSWTTSSSMQDLVSFDGSKVCLTGVSLHCLLKQGCRIFSKHWRPGQSDGCRRASEYLDYFVSHNWSVSRTRKMIALYTHFNITFAAFGSSLICAAVLFGVIYSEVPLPGYIFPYGRGYWEGVICKLTFYPAFMFCLVTGSDFARCFPTRRKSVFLDRLCIDQFNQELKQQAILRLGAFIKSSRMMIVLYTDVYVQRLWTIYEVAAFLTLHDIDHMKVLHLEKTTLLFINFLVAYALILMAMLSLFVFESLIVVMVAFYIQALTVCWEYRKFRKRKKMTLEKLDRFRLEECVCSDERDRPLVYTNIATLLRGIGKVEPHSSQDDALRAFEVMVRESLPRCIGRQSFELQFGYHQYLILGFFYGGPVCFDILSGMLQDGGEPSQFLIALLIQRNTEWMAFFPMCMMVTELVAHGFLHLEGWREILYIVPGFTFAFAVCWSLQVVFRNFVETAAASTTAFAVHLAICVILDVSIWRVATWLHEPYKLSSNTSSLPQQQQQGQGVDPENQLPPPPPTPPPISPLPPRPPPASSSTQDVITSSEDNQTEDKVLNEAQRWSV